MVDYVRSRARAYDQIQKNGKRVEILARVRVGGSDRIPVYEDQVHLVWGLELFKETRNLDGSLSPNTRHTLMIPALLAPIQIEKEHRVRVGGKTYSVDQVRPLQPGPVLILWEVDLAN